jgi:hypothetical protein
VELEAICSVSLPLGKVSALSSAGRKDQRAGNDSLWGSGPPLVPAHSPLNFGEHTEDSPQLCYPAHCQLSCSGVLRNPVRMDPWHPIKLGTST